MIVSLLLLTILTTAAIDEPACQSPIEMNREYLRTAMTDVGSKQSTDSFKRLACRQFYHQKHFLALEDLYPGGREMAFLQYLPGQSLQSRNSHTTAQLKKLWYQINISLYM
jgi:hypothetical protein